MSSVHVSYGLILSCQAIQALAAIIANRVREEDVYIVLGIHGDFELRFADNTAYFMLDYVVEHEGDKVGFVIKLLLNDTEYWSQRYDEITFDSFDEVMRVYANSGFPTGGNNFMWSATACEPMKIPYYVEEDDLPLGDSFDNEYGSISEGADWGSSLSGSDEETSVDGGGTAAKFSRELGRGQPCIVPDNVGRIRVVALKYKGNVIAFRFKTDAGAFDMGKSAAARYGLGGFKTETFITLESVNGLLMSSSERKNQVCVPDVSDCQEDCDKLIRALFGT